MRFRSLNMPQIVDLALDNLTTPLPDKSWVNYPLGCIAQFIRRGFAPADGYDIMVWGNVPAGAGLSSSAALEVVTAFAFNEVLGCGFDRTELAKIGQLSEHEFAGVNCGIMDQFASAQGKKDYAIFLNCDTLHFDWVPVKLDGVKVVISNTHSPHKLDSGEYNARVAQCQKAVEQISTVRPIRNLAELTAADFALVESAITDPVAHRRARHVVGEVQRTADAVVALRKGDIATFGRLMNQSHVSLRDDYEVTGPELDALAEAAWAVDGVIGSRMTVGGFGGCTINLVKKELYRPFIDAAVKEFSAKFGHEPKIYDVVISDGARKLSV